MSNWIGSIRTYSSWRPAAAATLVVGLAAWQSGACYAVIRYTGVNLSGAEFGATPTPGNLGTYGTNYKYPTSTEVNYFVGKGMNTFRMPFRWERLQHSQFAALDPTELAHMDAFVNYATSQGASVIIDPHNFERYYPDPANFQQSAQGLVGTDVPDAAFADFWGQIADHYKNNGNVIFDLNNEPANVPAPQVVASENAAIAAIRAKGAANLIQVPGTSYTGAWTWVSSGNADAMISPVDPDDPTKNLVDPGNNFVFEVHQYFDRDGSGSIASTSNSPQIGNSGAGANNTNIGVERLTAFTNWLHAENLAHPDKHYRGFLGEFALPNARFGDGSATTGTTVNKPKVADETLQATLNYINANSDVWTGWAWWGGGPFWNVNSYMFGLDPTTYANPTPAQEAAAMPYLIPYLAGPITDLPGDFNQDGYVDQGDLPAFRTSFLPDLVNSTDPLNPDVYVGLTGTALAADVNHDGEVDGADFLIWQQNLGATPATVAAAAAVPEPTAFVLAAAAAVVASARATRGRRG